MQGLKFRIQHANGQLEDLQIEGERVTIGSGAHCEIRLGLDEAASEHVAIMLQPSGLVAEARSFQPPPTINESQFNRSPVAPGAVIGIGNSRIWVEAGELSEGAEVKKATQQKTSPMTYVLLLVALPAVYVLLMDDSGSGQIELPKAPELWAEARSQCKQKGQAAYALAEQKESYAISKRERRPFFAEDGVRAVPLFEEAAACYRAAGYKKDAKRNILAARKLRKSVALEYRSHRMRLDHALTIGSDTVAQREVRILLAMTQHVQGPYPQYLRQLERKYRLTIGVEE